jgi:hypothetical protein
MLTWMILGVAHLGIQMVLNELRKLKLFSETRLYSFRSIFQAYFLTAIAFLHWDFIQHIREIDYCERWMKSAQQNYDAKFFPRHERSLHRMWPRSSVAYSGFAKWRRLGHRKNHCVQIM